MKAASVKWLDNVVKTFGKSGDLAGLIKGHVKAASEKHADILVLPALTGCLFQKENLQNDDLRELIKASNPDEYLDFICKLSREFGMAICPGSYWERENDRTYHASCIAVSGEIRFRQRQIYLARWERELGLSRGTAVEQTIVGEFSAGIALGTDVFYPQVSRMLALQGADIVLAPVAFRGDRCEALQISGMWQETQQNLFFAVESGFNGYFGEISFWGESMIHAPLDMIPGEDGFLARSHDGDELIISELENDKRKNVVANSDVISQLNREFYRRMGMFGGCYGN